MLWRHALPNALGPTLQVIALNIAYLAGGVVIVEVVVQLPGHRRSRCATRPRRATCRSCSSSPCSSPAIYVVVQPARRRRDDPRHAAPADEAAMIDVVDPSTLACQPRSPMARHAAAGMFRTRVAAVAHAHRAGRSSCCRRRRSPSSARGRAARPDRVRRHAEHPQRRRLAVRHRLPRPGRVVAVPARRPDRSSCWPSSPRHRPRARRRRSASSPPTTAAASTTS